MKLMALAALACGFVAAPMGVATTASADPSCDGAGCVPYVTPNVKQGDRCTLGTRYVFGVDASGKTYICTGQQVWAQQSMPLVGVRTERQFCGDSKGWAQSPDGLPMSCNSQGWTQDFSAVYFPVYQPPRY